MFLQTFQQLRPDLLEIDDKCLVKIKDKPDRIGIIIDKDTESTKYKVKFSDRTSQWFTDKHIYRTSTTNYPLICEYQKEKDLIQKIKNITNNNIVPATFNDFYRIVIMPRIKTDLYFLSQKKEKKPLCFFKL